MTSGNLSRSLLARRLRDILVLTDEHRRLSTPSGGIPNWPQSQLPEVRISAQHFIDMGLRPADAERLLICFLEFVTRYRGAFDFHFGRVDRAGCFLPLAYYRDTFAILFKRTIQSWESQIVTSVQVWLCQTVFSPDLLKECVDIRVDDTIKNDILSKLGLKTTLLASSKRGTDHSVMTAQLEEVYEKDDTLLAKRSDPYPALPVSPSIFPVATTPRSNDLHGEAISSTCFPTRYPPPRGESPTLLQRPFVTSFTCVASAHTEKASVSRSADIPPLISLFGQMRISGLEAGTKPQRSSKGFPRNPKSKKTEPLPPLLSPIVVDASGTSCKTQSTVIGLAPTPKSTPVKRRRRIAPLPNRHKGSISSSDSDSSSSVTYGAVPSFGVTSRVPPMHIAVDRADASSGISCLRLTPPTQNSAETSSPSTSKPFAPKQRKANPLPRRVPPRPQGTFSSQQTALATLPELNGPSHPVPRSPSLILDTSSSSSSDELDTPPSTPPHVSSLRSTLAESKAIPPKVDVLTSRRSPSLGDGVLPKSRERIIHIDLTKGVGGQERPLTFTFGV